MATDVCNIFRANDNMLSVVLFHARCVAVPIIGSAPGGALFFARASRSLTVDKRAWWADVIYAGIFRFPAENRKQPLLRLRLRAADLELPKSKLCNFDKYQLYFF